MKRIPLTQGKEARVSDCDYTYLMQWKWCFVRHHSRNSGYAQRKIYQKETIYMHKVVALRMGIEDEVDHRDRDKLNNQRRNLRPATRGQNQANQDRQKNNTSEFIGVSRCTNRDRWVVQIQIDGRRQNLGRFPYNRAGKIAAALAYNKAARRHFGKFAVLNKV